MNTAQKIALIDEYITQERIDPRWGWMIMEYRGLLLERELKKREEEGRAHY